ncbi:Uncharacterised protein [Mycobacteroides abscessus subsp. abscessus]|uniref:hypothetical protein n=1 Tax=Mycobacteroides abscessus TaxID=36809 RepID=UPI00092B821C|nr:hypothetical protein [Mycobacteroides abscessus]SIB94577.1 Uncharacterised protein [Mycobacteroides abscessus subsp. abscessus]
MSHSERPDLIGALGAAAANAARVRDQIKKLGHDPVADLINDIDEDLSPSERIKAIRDKLADHMEQHPPTPESLAASVDAARNGAAMAHAVEDIWNQPDQ